MEYMRSYFSYMIILISICSFATLKKKDGDIGNQHKM